MILSQPLMIAFICLFFFKFSFLNTCLAHNYFVVVLYICVLFQGGLSDFNGIAFSLFVVVVERRQSHGKGPQWSSLRMQHFCVVSHDDFVALAAAVVVICAHTNVYRAKG